MELVAVGLGALGLRYLLNLHVQPRTVWLTRHGASAFNVLGRIGGDAPLSDPGRTYARTLASFVRERIGSPLVVWTSTLRRTIQTAENFGFPYRAWRALDEVDAGVCDGMTYAEIADAMPHEYEARASDKFRYRYPRGESYQDMIQPLEPVIFELERERAPVLVIGHQAVRRAVRALCLHDGPAAAGVSVRVDPAAHDPRARALRTGATSAASTCRRRPSIRRDSARADGERHWGAVCWQMPPTPWRGT